MNYQFSGTPGPWVADIVYSTFIDNDTYKERPISRFRIIMNKDHGFEPVCDGFGNLNTFFPSIEQGASNAHLIAAAPDMLNALIGIDNLSDLFSYPEVSSQFESEAQAVGRAMLEVKKAIHKALNLPL